MTIRAGWIVSLLTAVLTVMPLFGDELDNYSKTLDRVENGFWNAVFTKNQSTRDKYKNMLNSLRECARKINQLEYINSVPRNSGDLTSNVVRISNLITDNIAFRKKFMVFSNIKKTNLDVYRKAVSKERGRSSRSLPLAYNELSPTDYKEFLNNAKDSNVDSIEKRLRSTREFNSSQRDFLVKTAESFYTCITELRLTILKMRQQHPVFKPKNNQK